MQRYWIPIKEKLNQYLSRLILFLKMFMTGCRMYMKMLLFLFPMELRVFQVVTNLKATAESEGRELAKSYEKTVVLATIDDAWKEHLREMDELKQSVQNATYEQKDPLLIYKFESFELFKTMLNQRSTRMLSALL
ncbi:MAG: hypothetical protein MZV63_11950 [Marinilabiliales bacterium]|nr:hypothetical protein [Marinilabiliales bacterium]